MKNLIYLFIVSTAWLFAACQDVTVGYLMVDEAAGYPQDTLHIMNAQKKLQALQGIEADFYAHTKEIQDEIAEIQKEIDKLNEAWQVEYDETIQPIYDEIEEIYAKEEMTDADYVKVDQLYAEAFDKTGELDLKYGDLKYPFEEDIYEKTEELEGLAEKMGIGSLDILKKQISDVQDKVKFELPWVTPKIQGILGTEPMQYSILRVKNENAGNAEKFMSYAGVMGGGMLYVDSNFDLPDGNYTLTLEVRNEGRSRVLEDIFTFVVDSKLKMNITVE